MCFIAPGQVHEIRGQGVRGIIIVFGTGFVRQIAGGSGVDVENQLFRHFDRAPFIDVDASVSPSFSSLVRMMQDEYSRDRPDWMIIRGLLAVFLMYANRLRGEDLRIEGGANHERVTKLLAAIDRHYLTERKVEFYAKSLGLSPKRINQLTREALGKTVVQLVYDRIVLAAKRELVFTTLSVKEIGFDLGFEDPGYFSRFFKRVVGASPHEFRNEHGEGR